MAEIVSPKPFKVLGENAVTQYIETLSARNTVISQSDGLSAIQRRQHFVNRLDELSIKYSMRPPDDDFVSLQVQVFGRTSVSIVFSPNCGLRNGVIAETCDCDDPSTIKRWMHIDEVFEHVTTTIRHQR